MKHLIAVAVALAILGGLLDTDVAAWGPDGHKIVCAIAYKFLSGPDKAEVDRLTHLYRDPDGHGISFFTTSCTFADTARGKAGDHVPGWTQFAQFDKWHFLNLPRTEHVVQESACGGNCVLKGIQHHFDQLRNHGLTDKVRAEALIFLGHWVGDIHQPLHISYEDDRGGNFITPISGGFYNSSHLHGVWDSGIIARTHSPTTDWWTYAGQLQAAVTPALKSQWETTTEALAWSQESYDITIEPDVRYCRWSNNQCRSIAGGRQLTSSYQQKYGQPVEQRLQKAGVRLASLITKALHP